MPLSVDTRKVAKAWVVAWKNEEGVYGVAYEMSDGFQGADKIGTKAQAEAIVKDIARHKDG